jgi:hypothetical protein
MSSNLRLWVFTVAFAMILVIIQILKKGRMPVKYSLVWFLSAAIIMIVAIFPSILSSIAALMGFATISNMVIGMILVILLFITMALTIIVSGQKEKIRLLIQEISMLKEKVNNNEK